MKTVKLSEILFTKRSLEIMARMCGQSAKVNIELDAVQMDTLIAILEEMHDIKETLAQYALVSGDDDLYKKALHQIDVTKELSKVFENRKSEYWGGRM